MLFLAGQKHLVPFTQSNVENHLFTQSTVDYQQCTSVKTMTSTRVTSIITPWLPPAKFNFLPNNLSRFPVHGQFNAMKLHMAYLVSLMVIDVKLINDLEVGHNLQKFLYAFQSILLVVMLNFNAMWT